MQGESIAEDQLRTEPKGLVLCDVDGTLYDATAAIRTGISKLWLRPTPHLGLAFIYWMMKSRKGRDWFSKKVDGLYECILKQNGPERMEDFYRFVASSPEFQHEGAVELLRTFTAAQLQVALISGNDRRYLEIFADENGLTREAMELIGADFEVENGRYTSKCSTLIRGATEKRIAVRHLQRRYPNVPVRFAFGDDEADIPLFEAAAKDDGMAVMIGDNPRLLDALEVANFDIFTDWNQFMLLEQPQKILRVSARSGSGRATLADLASHFKIFIG